MKNVIFMGSPQFAVPSLKLLIEYGYNIVGVFTQPPRPAGRGMKTVSTPIDILAQQCMIPVFYELSFEAVQRLMPDLIIVCAYGKLIPENILKLSRIDVLNVHASILPRWRGACPMQHAILAGDKETGVSIMRVVKAMDKGAVFATHSVPIEEHTNILDLHDSLSVKGADLLIRTIQSYSLINPIEQNDFFATYAPKINIDIFEINWNLSAIHINRIIRALFPYCWTNIIIDSTVYRIKILETEVIDMSSINVNVGMIVNDDFYISCRVGILRIITIHPAGSVPMSTKDFIKRKHIVPIAQ